MKSPEWESYRPSPPAAGQRLNGAILFADVQGYGRLRESDLPNYAAAILAPVARLLDNHETHVLTRNSWGDAIFAVFDDVAVAAECAVAIQQTIGSVNRNVLGYPFDLGVRLAGHYGPIRPIFDPIQGRETYVGTQVVQAARIEPVTEPGMIHDICDRGIRRRPGIDPRCPLRLRLSGRGGHGQEPWPLAAIRAAGGHSRRLNLNGQL